MPYQSVKDLPAVTKKLPVAAKVIWMGAFNRAIKTKTEEEAFKIAWAAVKKLYTQKNSKWVRRKNV